jgi:hypothetical protein
MSDNKELNQALYNSDKEPKTEDLHELTFTVTCNDEGFLDFLQDGKAHVEGPINAIKDLQKIVDLACKSIEDTMTSSPGVVEVKMTAIPFKTKRIITED